MFQRYLYLTGTAKASISFPYMSSQQWGRRTLNYYILLFAHLKLGTNFIQKIS
ncbi:hypothetical protein IGK30_003453 [Enterococcus sp. AZ178]